MADRLADPASELRPEPRDDEQAAPSGAAAVVASLVVAATAVLVLALAATGGTPEPAPGGLPDAGPVTGWALPLTTLLAQVAATATVGLLLVGLLPVTRDDRPRVPSLAVAACAGAWAALSLVLVVLELSQAVGRPVGDVLRAELLRSWVVDTDSGRALLLSAVVAGAVALGAAVAAADPPPAVRVALLAGALLAVVPPLRTGHAATAEDHALAVTALVVHVGAVVLWVGGLAALALGRSRGLAVAVPRFSALALGCFVAVAVSGVVGAQTRLASLDALWATAYGALVLTKGALLVGLGVAGLLHRRRTVGRVIAGDRAAFRRLAVGELAVMAAAFGVATALSGTAA